MRCEIGCRRVGGCDLPQVPGVFPRSSALGRASKGYRSLLPDARTFTGVAAMPRPKALFRCGYRERSRGKEAFWLTQDLTDRIRNIDRPAKLAFAAKVLGEALEVSRVGCGVVDLRPKRSDLTLGSCTRPNGHGRQRGAQRRGSHRWPIARGLTVGRRSRRACGCASFP